MKINEKFFRNYVCNLVIVVLIIGLVSLTFFNGAISVFTNASIEPFYHGDKNAKNVSIMVNVYMGSEYVEQILEITKQSNIKVTFFVGGIWVSKNSDLLQKIYDSGNEIGNHGYWHKDHDKISREQNKNEISLCHELVEATTSYSMNLFAPPSGAFNKTTLQVANELGYKTIMWTKDTIDWRDQNAQQFVERATKNPTCGDLILMHPTKCTVECLPDVISYYVNLGYNLTTVSENITVKGLGN